MSEVTLVRVLRTTQETKYGVKPKLVIKTEQHGDKWLSTFKMAGTENWAEGDTVRINVQEKGDFLNFEPVAEAAQTSVAQTSVGAGVSTAQNMAVAPAIPDIEMDGNPFADDEEVDGEGF